MAPMLHAHAISAAVLSARSEEHTAELQSRENLVCRLLLEKKKKKCCSKRKSLRQAILNSSLSYSAIAEPSRPFSRKPEVLSLPFYLLRRTKRSTFFPCTTLFP